MCPLVRLEMGALGVDLLAVRETALVDPPLLVPSQPRVAKAQVRVGKGFQAKVGRGGGGGGGV